MNLLFINSNIVFSALHEPSVRKALSTFVVISSDRIEVCTIQNPLNLCLIKNVKEIVVFLLDKFLILKVFPVKTLILDH